MRNRSINMKGNDRVEDFGPCDMLQKTIASNPKIVNDERFKDKDGY